MKLAKALPIEAAIDDDSPLLNITTPDSLTSLSLKKRAFTKITWSGPRQVRQSPFAPVETLNCLTQRSSCDRSRGARAWITDIYVEPNPNIEALHGLPIYYFPNPADAHPTGPHPNFPNLGTGPFAGCLPHETIFYIVNLVNYKQAQQNKRGGVGTSIDVKQAMLGGKSVDIVFTAGDSIDQKADLDYIDMEVQALVGGGGSSRPDGYKTLASKTCEAPQKVRECRIDNFPQGADRLLVHAHAVQDGQITGANGNVVPYLNSELR
ncbi:uncharacterized protein KY384_006146 [Bacidia gigantensis]|uniref:uncharacterized protein n=1 Tax=Bacidia gigantensis TaxID=2732470 RepID=UPI001D050D90|nr:uncharacterized protein KY384_006146 [Bacidia gigantensis]KAG8529509.1 hypothetical protein KY384_006146 [Bacidia gigantensis]